MDALLEDKELSSAISREISEQKLATTLFTMRNHEGMTQEQVARKMGCSQSAVSKLEHATDEQITIGDIVRYSSALGLKLTVQFRKNMNAVESVKYHFFHIKKHLDHLRELAKADSDIRKGVDKFYNEWLLNMLQLYKAGKTELSRKKTRFVTQKPVLEVNAPEHIPDDSEITELLTAR